MPDSVRIQLCGSLVVEIAGRRIERELAGRRGRLLIAYLVVHRPRSIRRSELADALWPGRPPPATDASLRRLLSKLRRPLPPGWLDGRSELRLKLPADAFVDVEVAREAVRRAESAVAQGQWQRAWAASMTPLLTARRRFLAAEHADWITHVRAELDDLYLRSLECYARACLELGGIELAGAERAGRALIERAPYREGGYCHLMRALMRTGDTAEALRIYERLRILLRDEFGIAPSADIRSLHTELLGRPAPAC